MQIGKTLYITQRKKWRAWLRLNCNKEKEIWLIYYKKDSGKPRISYNAAVEEALCYGWIDSTVKSIDNNCFAQRFTPRRRTSVLSQMNKERVRDLIKKRKMTKVGLQALAHVYNPKTDKPKKVEIPADILIALKANKEVWKNFQKFSERYKRIRIAYIQSQTQHSEKQGKKALRHFIKMTAKNKRFGMIK